VEFLSVKLNGKIV